MVKESCRSAPDDDIAMLQGYAALFVFPGVAAE
jgi:hypothetical protein